MDEQKYNNFTRGSVFKSASIINHVNNRAKLLHLAPDMTVLF